MGILLDNILCRHWLENVTFDSSNITGKSIYFLHPHHYFYVEDTIHFNSITTNNYEMYNTYVTETNQKEHSVDTFKKLIDNFDINKMKKIKVLYFSSIGKYIVMDGVHRLSILKYNNIISDCVPLELLEITYDNNTINEIKEMLSKTTQKSFYNGWNNRTTYGYHSFNISNIKLEGQRQPHIRLNKMNKFIDFKNKTIIDFGCNNGGMLLHLPQIKEGWGLDYSEDCIIAANKISNILKYNNKTVFIQKDLNKFNYDEFIKNNNIGKVDIIFLLSLGSWIKEWKSLYSKSYNIADTIILETNNDKEGIPQLELFENLGANIKLISSTSNDDTTNNYGRKTYIITK